MTLDPLADAIQNLGKPSGTTAIHRRVQGSIEVTSRLAPSACSGSIFAQSFLVPSNAMDCNRPSSSRVAIAISLGEYSPVAFKEACGYHAPAALTKGASSSIFQSRRMP